MTLQQLEYIMAVARHGHFGRAADACNVTQPTLSAMIGKLEEEIGAKLFDRNRQPIVPTSVGERVILQAREVLAQADSIKDSIGRKAIVGWCVPHRYLAYHCSLSASSFLPATDEEISEFGHPGARNEDT